jgi:hypothetical protein
LAPLDSLAAPVLLEARVQLALQDPLAHKVYKAPQEQQGLKDYVEQWVPRALQDPLVQLDPLVHKDYKVM